MPVNNIDIPFPLGGLNRTAGYTNQPPQTSRDLQNVRGVDKRTERLRGTQREGLKLFITGGTLRPAQLIRRIEPIVRDERRVTYTLDATPDTVWERQPQKAKTNAELVRVAESGNVYVLATTSGTATGAASWSKFNAYGYLLHNERVDIPIPTTALLNPVCGVTGFWVDEFENVYASTGYFAFNSGVNEIIGDGVYSGLTITDAVNSVVSGATWAVTPVAGDTVIVVSGSNALTGTYTVSSATASNITLSVDAAGPGAGSATNCSIYIRYNSTTAASQWAKWGTNPGRIYKWTRAAVGEGYELAWEIELGDFETCTDIIVRDGVMYTLQPYRGGNFGARYSKLVTYRNLDSTLAPEPDDEITISGTTLGLTTTDVIFRRFAIRNSDGIEFVICGGDDMMGVFVSTTPDKNFILKLNEFGDTRWIVHRDLAPPASFPAGAQDNGYGMGVCVDKDGNIFTTGVPATISDPYAIKFSDAASGVLKYEWGYAAVSSYNNYWGYPATDQYGNFFVGKGPSANDAVVLSSSGTVVATAATGTRVSSSAVTPPDSLATIEFKEDDTKYPEFLYSAGTDTVGTTFLGVTYTHATRTLSLGGGFGGFTPHEGEFIQITSGTGATVGFYAVLSVTATTIVLASAPGTADQTNYTVVVGLRPLVKSRLIAVASSVGSPRSHVCAVAAPPALQVFAPSTGYVTPGGLLGGGNCLDSNARYVSSAFLVGKLFVSDGLNYVYLDPTSTTTYPNGRVERWEPRTSGLMPQRAKLVFPWRDRIGLSRCPDDPQNFYLSATNDPFDWDLGPVTPTITQAIQGNLSPAGAIPDLPNAFIPYTDDLLLVLCDHSIWQISGNPLRGAEIDRISGVVGGSFGKPYCVDPEGAIYFHGSRGGIFRMAPRSIPERISTNSIDADLAEIDLQYYFVELIWDDRAQGIHVFQLPYGLGATPVQHWFFERRTGAWIPQKYASLASTSNQPTAVAVFDGDNPSDRRVLLAGEDRHMSYLDPLSRSDRTGNANGGTPIYSYVLIGPIVARQQSDRVSRLVSVDVTLAADRGGCSCEVYMSNTPDVLDGSVLQVELKPGFNSFYARARGRYIFLRLFNAEADRDWAFESASAVVADAGGNRV